MIGKALIVALLIAAPASGQVRWIESSKTLIPAGSPSKAPGIWISTVTPSTFPKIPLPPNVWHTIDLSDGPAWGTWQPGLPDTTNGVELAGILIITNATHVNTVPVTCQVWATFRAPGDDTHHDNFHMQTLTIPNKQQVSQGDGSRSNAVVTVQTINRRFEFYYHYTPDCGVLPSGTAVNLTIQKVLLQ